MFDITVDHLFEVYKQLEGRSDLVMTTTSVLNAEVHDEFTIDCPIIVCKAHDKILYLYVYEEMFILDVMDNTRTKGTHWHPNNVEYAVYDIEEFMNGKADYKMQPFIQG